MDAVKTLQQRFGFPDFRPGQPAIVNHMAQGGDALVVMPTGAGKSICFQVPALMRGGTTIVVSPLIALMKDQVDGLQQHDIRATCLNSSIPRQEYERRFEALVKGEIELLYVAPERFTPSFLRTLERVDIRMLAIDEAHCLSQWGHDFRPDYLRLGKTRQALGCPPTIALTATATPEVQEDIRKVLGIEGGRTFIQGFDRENLVLEVIGVDNKAHKDSLLADLVQPGPTLVYCATRKNVDRATSALRSAGIRAGMYHAGLSADERTRIQDAFMAGSVPIVVATNAFGMGIDKRDLRAIVHYDMPGTLEAYYQEIGRAGRDGRISRAVLLHQPSDRRIHEFFIDNSHPPAAWIQSVNTWLEGRGKNPVFASLDEVASCLPDDGGDKAAGACVRTLVREGYVRRIAPSDRSAWLKIRREPARSPAGLRGKLYNHIRDQSEMMGSAVVFWPERWCRQLDVDRASLTAALRGLEERGIIDYQAADRVGGFEMLKPGHPLRLDEPSMRKRRSREYQKLDRMETYTVAVCRRKYIIEYFGESAPFETCGTCDVCRSGTATLVTAQIPTPDQEQVLLKILSCVARMERKTDKPGWGVDIVAKTLTGSKARKVTVWGFDQLTTHGLLGTWKPGEVSDVIAAMVDAGALQANYVTRKVGDRDLTYKEVQMTQLGNLVMRRKAEDFVIKFPHARRLKRNRPTKRANSDVPSDLLATLRDIRRQLAEARQVPAYVVAPNRTLEDLARQQPVKVKELGRIHGMGDTRSKLYGKAFVEAICAWQS